MTGAFHEVAKIIGRFLVRDVLYIIGGGSVFVALLYALGKPPAEAVPMWGVLLGAGVAYGAGYAIQEILSMAGLVTTAPVLRPGKCRQRLYRRFTGSEWRDLPRGGQEWDEKRYWFLRLADERTSGRFERIANLKHVGSALGSSWLVVGGIFLVKALWLLPWCNGGNWRDPVFLEHLLVGVLVIVVAVGLILVAWVKGMEQVQYVQHDGRIGF